MAKQIQQQRRPSLSREQRSQIRRTAWAKASALREEFVRVLDGALIDLALEYGAEAALDQDEIERAVVHCLEALIEARS